MNWPIRIDEDNIVKEVKEAAVQKKKLAEIICFRRFGENIYA